MQSKIVSEAELAGLAKAAREAAGKSRADAAKELGCSWAAVLRAEENPQKSMLPLRKKIIEAYSDQAVTGPHYILMPQSGAKAKKKAASSRL